MSDDDHGAPFLGQTADGGKHLADQFRIQRRGRLVEQDHVGLHRERAGNRHALLLTAGEAPGIRIFLALQPDLGQQCPAALDGLAEVPSSPAPGLR